MDNGEKIRRWTHLAAALKRASGDPRVSPATQAKAAISVRRLQACIKSVNSRKQGAEARDKFNSDRMWAIVKDTAWVVMLALGIYLFMQQWQQRAHGPHSGDRCGPHHHWRFAGGSFNSDLSCESD